MPVMIAVLCILAIAYRYYSAFLAARVATLDDTKQTPAELNNDGQNFHPTSKWVLFGHHFAAISGAGPLIGPVLAAQFGYLPGLLWIVIGVCLAGAVQDFLVLSMSIRRGGRSLAQIAYSDVGKTAGTAATLAILFIIVIALAGLGRVVVNSLGGEEVKYPADAAFIYPTQARLEGLDPATEKAYSYSDEYEIPAGTQMVWNKKQSTLTFTSPFVLRIPKPTPQTEADIRNGIIPAGAARVVPGSSWGTFTIACTIPIALLVGFYMYRLRKGATVEASLIGGALTIAATIAGGWLAHSRFASAFDLSTEQVKWAMGIYGFIAAVLPVWVLLTPRDYLSSFLKIGTILVLVIGTLIANPKFEAPAFNSVFVGGGPIIAGKIFPFLFITIMCGAISGFHALVSSGTTPKMITRESHARTIGYGAMLIEGLVGVVAMIAAAALPVQDYYAMNMRLDAAPKFEKSIALVGGGGGIEHLNQYETLTQESLHGRVGGAVTLAVGMAHIFDGFARRFSSGEWLDAMWKYWYHFAIMFEALFILTTIDAGTRIGRFLLQEVAGKFHPQLGIAGGWPSAIISTAVMVVSWTYFMGIDSFNVIWAMFGIANQMLAVIALAIVTAYLFNVGKGKYAWVTVLPMCVVFTTTSSAAVTMLAGLTDGIRAQIHANGFSLANATLRNALIQSALILVQLVCAIIVIVACAMRVWRVSEGEKQRGFAVAQPA